MIGPTWEIKAGGYSGRGSGGPRTAPTATFVSRAGPVRARSELIQLRVVFAP